MSAARRAFVALLALAACHRAPGARRPDAPPRTEPPAVSIRRGDPCPECETPCSACQGAESAVERSPHVALGVPRDADPADDHLLDKEHFVVSFNARYGGPNWVAWRLTRDDLGTSPRTRGFVPDRALPSSFYAVTNDDYAGSGYDRGHLCPSADRTRSLIMNAATFVFTNVQPQVHELNAGPWEELEQHARALTRQGRDLWIVAGGVFDRAPKRIGRAGRVAVPAAAFKVIVAAVAGAGPAGVHASSEVVAVVMPNAREVAQTRYRDYLVSIREIEELTGYDFHARLPRHLQEALETQRPAEAPRGHAGSPRR